MSFAAYPMPHVGLLGQQGMGVKSYDGESLCKPSPYEIEDRGFTGYFACPPVPRVGIKTSNSKPNGIHLCQIGCEIAPPRIVSPTNHYRGGTAVQRAKPFVRDLKQSRTINKAAFGAPKRIMRMPLANLAVDSMVPTAVGSRGY